MIISHHFLNKSLKLKISIEKFLKIMECSDEMKGNMERLGTCVWATILAQGMARNDTTKVALKTPAE